MTAINVPIGVDIRAEILNPAQFASIHHKTPKTVLDVLDQIKTLYPTQPHSLLRTVAGHVANSLNVPFLELTLNEMSQAKPMFSSYLRSKGRKPHSVHTYVGLASRILKFAGKFGWVKSTTKAEAAWAPILERIGMPLGCRGIAVYAMGKGMLPRQLTDLDLLQWAMWLIRAGRSYNYAQQRLWHFRRAAVKAGLQSEFPHISAPRKQQQMGIPVSQMPEPLRSQIQEVLRWKQAKRAKGRPRKGRLREVSARIVEGGLTRLYGYAVTVLGKTEIKSMLELVNEEILDHYINWCLERNLKPCSLSWLGVLSACLKYHPDFEQNDFSWFTNLLNSIEQEDESTQRERKDKKYLPYDVLAEIPDKLAAQRRATDKTDTKRIAYLFHDELLIRWLLIMPWRQRNIREAELGGGEEPNIFRGPLSELFRITKPEWVENELKQNPKASFWQIWFRPHETKTGQSINAVLPKRIVPMLEEYLEKYRPVIVAENDQHTLFLNRAGRPLLSKELRSLVGDLTMRHAGRYVTPHLFRDAFANKWLDEHPEDFLTVSKALWHRNINTTIKIYGRGYDEAAALRKIEQWIEEKDRSRS